MRLLAAKTYGLLTYDRGIVQLTELGMRAADPLREKRARFDAFMSVGLYKRLFDRLNGQTLPPVAAIELMMERLGVSAKLKEKARQVFMRAAENAGLLELSSDRLSTPPGLDAAPRQNDTPQQEEQKNKGGGGDDGTPPLHPFIDGLLRTLPKPETVWPTNARVKWLQAAANIFDPIYEDGAQATDPRLIKIAVQKGEAVGA